MYIDDVGGGVGIHPEIYGLMVVEAHSDFYNTNCGEISEYFFIVTNTKNP